MKTKIIYTNYQPIVKPTSNKEDKIELLLCLSSILSGFLIIILFSPFLYFATIGTVLILIGLYPLFVLKNK